MFLSDPAASRAKTLVDQAQQTQVLSPTAAAELASLLASLDAAPLSALLPSILASPLVPDLQRCGIEAAATRLLSTQQTAQTIHACFAGIVDALDRIERALEDSPDSGAPLLHLARTCVEKLAQCVERQQQSAVLWEDPSAAPSLVKASDCSVRMLTRCAGFKLRHDKHVAETCVRITKAAARTVDLIAALFKSVAGVAEGRQQWLQQYANHVLERHRAMLAMPQQFKSTWDALCAISEVSGPELCLRVYMQSCDSVRSLANQTTLQLQRISAEEFADAKVQRKLKGPLAFIRYLVFQLPALVARVLAADRAVHWDKLVKAAMGMLDAVFGKLATPDSLARTPEGIEADVRKLAVVVCDKFVLALLAHSTQPLTQHLDDLDAFLRHPGHKCLQLPLLKGLIQPAAHRAVLRVVVESISSFSASQQQELMQSGRPTIVQALVLAIDRDPASLFSHNSKGPTAGHRYSDYESLVTAIALCAIHIDSSLYGRWEECVLHTAIVSSAGSLGARAAVDAWIATSEHSMSHILAQSTIEGILDVVAGDTIRIDDTNRARLGRLLGGMMKTLSISECSTLLTRVSSKVTSSARVCAVVPWKTISNKAGHPQTIEQTIVGVATKLMAQANNTGHTVETLWALMALLPALSSQNLSKLAPDVFGLLRRTLSSSDHSLIAYTLLVAGTMTPTHISLSASLLSQLDATSLTAPTGVAMAHFVGSFASGHVDASQIESLVPQMAQIFALLFSDSSPWIVRHEACKQALCFATESACPEVTMRIVPESAHAMLTAFIQRSSSTAMEVEENGFQEMYQGVFDINAPKFILDDALSNNDSRRIVDSAITLARDLELSNRSRDPQLRIELARLSKVIDRFLSK